MSEKPKKARKAPTPEVVPAVSPEGVDLSQPAAPPPPVQASSATDDRPASERLSVPLTAEGLVDYANMRESTKAKFHRAIGQVPGAAAVDGDQVRGLVPVLWGSIAMAGGYMLSSGLPSKAQEVVMQQMALTRQEIDALEGPTVAMLQKYLPVMTGWETEAAFLMAVVAVFPAKIAAVSSLRAELKRQSTEPPPMEKPGRE